MANKQVSIVKIGGNVIENETALAAFLSDFSKMVGPKILVHGGGKKATKLSETLGIPTQMVEGRRITSKETVDVITMVYGGLINKNIVAQLQANGCNAIGLSGADGNAILSEKRPVTTIDYGYVGDVKKVNDELLTVLLNNGITPVFCAITHDKNGQLLNTNADTIASEIAIGISENFDTALYYCFEKKGVLRDVNDDNSVVTDINSETYKDLLANNIIADGMLPKMKNCFHALEHKVGKVCIGSPQMIQQGNTLFTTLTL
ncbi:MAG: acetylglutamate kinase [Flavobacteriales bacterium]|nr:acetylglutamate kinase [Flavobacteriales bacterium]